MADALGAGFRQSVWMVADELGFDLEPELRTTHDMAVATAHRLAHRPDPAGHGGGAAVPLGGPGGRRARHRRRRELADG